MICLSEYSELRGLPHHSFDVFFMGNSFPIDIRVFEHFVHHFERAKVITSSSNDRSFSEISLLFIAFYRISLIFINFCWFSLIFLDFHWLYSNFSEILSTFWWYWAIQISPRSSQTVLKHLKMESSCKNTSKLWCGSPRNSEYSQRQIILKFYTVCKKTHHIDLYFFDDPDYL